MTTKMRILSGLALSAATLVIAPLSSDEASARGLGGANSSAVARSSTTSPATQRTLKSSQTTLKTSKLREVDKDPGKTKIEKEKHKRHRAIYPVLIGPALLAVDPLAASMSVECKSSPAAACSA